MSEMDNFSADELLKRLKENMGEDVRIDDASEEAKADAKENAEAQKEPPVIANESEAAPEETEAPAGATEEAAADTSDAGDTEKEPDAAENTVSFTAPSEEDGGVSADDEPTEEFLTVRRIQEDEDSDSDNNDNKDNFDAPTMEIPDISGLETPDMEAFDAAKNDENEKIRDAVEEDDMRFDPSDIGIVVAVEGMDKAKKRFGADKVREAMNSLNLSDEDIPDPDEEDDAAYANPSGIFLGDEYESHEQTPEIVEKYKNEKSRIKLRLLGSAIFALCLLIFENLHLLGVNLPGAFNVNAYPAFHIFISLQLLVLAAALSYKEIIAGVRKMAYFVFDTNTVAFFAVALTAFCDLLIAFFASRGEFRLYNFAAVAVLVLCAAHDYLDIKRETNSFDVVSSKKPKYIVIAESRDGVRENDFGFRTLDEEPNRDVLLSVKKVGFVTKYFERTNAKTDANKYTPYFIFGAIAAAIIFAIIAGVNTKDAASAFAAANLCALLCLPIPVFFTSALPLFMASKQAHDNDSAIIGESAVDEYSGASTIIFDDKDIFPARSVKVKSIKMYGETPIDEILCDIAGVYSKLGGPLYEVLSKVTAEIGVREGVELTECVDGGVSAKFGEKTIVIGNSTYMEQNDIFPVYDYEDEIQLAGGNIRIMFVAYDGELATKMYIQYAIDPDFDAMLRRVHKNGMNVVIKTMDPNIDNSLLVGRTRPANYPAKIERRPIEKEEAQSAPASDSGVVSRASTKSLISTVLLCDKLRSVRFAANIIKIMSVTVALIIMLIFTISGSSTFILALFVALYHLFWVLPVFAVSKLCLN